MKVFAILMSLAVTSPAAAQGPLSQVLGMGAMDCRQTVELIGSKEFKIQLASWMNGYFSGLESGAPSRDLKGVNLDTTAADVYGYCARNPHGYVVEAAKLMYMALPRK